MQQLSQYEIISICASVGYIIADTILNKMNLSLNKIQVCLCSTLGGLFGVWVIADPISLSESQWVLAGISSFLSQYIIETFIEFKKKTTVSTNETKIDEILNILRKLDKK